MKEEDDDSLELPDELMEAALGLKTNDVAIYGTWFWVDRDKGPHNAEFLHRYVARRVRAAGAGRTAALEVNRTMTREAQTGQIEAIGVRADGEEIAIPRAIWQGYGERNDRLWRWAVYTDPARPNVEYRVFIREQAVSPTWAPVEGDTLTSWCLPNGVAENAARERLIAAGTPPRSEMAMCRELSMMWKACGREGGEPETIAQLRRQARG